MEQSIVEIISQHGYLALYILLVIGIIGLPLPDETLMTFVGSLTAEGGMLKYGTTLVISYCGAMTGMLVSYLLGYRIGQPFLYRFGKWVMLTPARLDKAEGWFHRYGLWTVFFGYFVPGLRQLTCYWAGVTRVPLWKYALYAGSGGLLWAATFVTLGHFIGGSVQYVMPLVHRYMRAAVAIAAVAGGAGLYLYWRMRKKKKSES